MRRNEILLDTHIILWAILKDKRLTNKISDYLLYPDNSIDGIKKIILNPQNSFYYSIASMWEVQIKHDKNKINISGKEFMHFCEMSGYHKLPVDNIHVMELESLKRDESAPPHNDPFDRIMLSQAIAEGFTFLTHDPLFRGYNERCVVEV